MKRWRLGSGLLVVAALLAVCLLAPGGTAPRQPVGVLTESDVETLAREGIQLTLPATPPKLTEEQIRQRGFQEAGPLADQAATMTVRRVVYVPPHTTAAQPAWLVTLNGLRMVNAGGPRVAPGVSNWLSTLLQKLGPRRPESTQLHILLDDNGSRIFSLSYR